MHATDIELVFLVAMVDDHSRKLHWGHGIGLHVTLLRRSSDTEYHPVGTCRMGPAGDAAAAVGFDVREHGVDGLRVADASIMPRITSGNTNAPSIMIGEKCADLMRFAA